MEKLTIQILDKKAIKKLQDLVNKKLIEIKKETSTEMVDWASFAGSLPKMSIQEIEKEIKEFRNWG
ncbi:MAG: hypothetical protein B7Z16_14080 [Algoriphagus sp. 32-45-6]|jgi:hypothetical protein|nr:MAG: hypothetical protein B7Z16_14080 [Algoriphagus sp. 32-45-6]